ncbi:hypothetical protein ACFYE9_09565 [Rhizobium leguminosarum]|uniref:Uncharacterized protein n=2 Tax=Rhizobium leguminosarum TaxID=384 RepID=A0A154IHQ1_RHILE|nr:hypothetical protein [Rhizobium leguminosarum]KZA99955.1 hypothetical protein A4A59_19460 [Rhizobium leguminosarum]
MAKWIGRAIAAVVIAGVGYSVYDAYRAGYFTRPEMPDGAFSLSYRNGLRAIVVDVPNEQEVRRYFGFPTDVPFYLKDAWSFCSAPADEEKEQVAGFMKNREWPGERFEAVCKIKVDDDVVVRGLITSVPKL